MTFRRATSGSNLLRRSSPRAETTDGSVGAVRHDWSVPETLPPTDDPAIIDPVLVRRAQIARLVDLGQKVGYGLFLVAIVAFVVTKIDKPTSLLTTIIAASMGIGSLILAPAIVFGYAVKAAARDDRQRAAAKAVKAERAARRVD